MSLKFPPFLYHSTQLAHDRTQCVPYRFLEVPQRLNCVHNQSISEATDEDLTTGLLGMPTPNPKVYVVGALSRCFLSYHPLRPE